MKIRPRGFTLIEMLVVITLMATLLVFSIRLFSYFSATAKLSETREVIDTLLISTNVNALTGKSIASDYYDINNSTRFQPSHYFLYFKKKKNWEDSGEVIYGELQKGLRLAGDQRDQDRAFFEVIYVDGQPIPFPVFLQDILWTKNGARHSESLSSDLLLFFEPPFGKVTFLPDASLIVKERAGYGLVDYKAINKIKSSDFNKELYLDLQGFDLYEGQVEFAFQYKDRVDEVSPTDEEGEHYLLREYIKYDSRNQLSHYWN